MLLVEHLLNPPLPSTFLRFEVLDCVRRLLLASVIGVVSSDSAAAPVLGLVISTVFIGVFSALKPFKSKDDNTLAVILAYSLMLLFLAALMIKLDATSDDEEDQEALGYILIAVLAAGPAALLFLTLMRSAHLVRHCGDTSKGGEGGAWGGDDGDDMGDAGGGASLEDSAKAIDEKSREQGGAKDHATMANQAQRHQRPGSPSPALVDGAAEDPPRFDLQEKTGRVNPALLQSLDRGVVGGQRAAALKQETGASPPTVAEL